MPLNEVYHYIYLIVVFVWTIYLYNSYKERLYYYNNTDNPSVYMGSIIFILFFSLLIGLRPMNAYADWADSGIYYRTYLLNVGMPFTFDTSTSNIIWDNLLAFWGCNRLGINSLFVITEFIYFGCTFIACKKWFPENVSASFAVFAGAFSTFSCTFNGVKAGMAGALFLVALAYYENRKTSILFLLLSYGFHHSMQMPIAAYIITLYCKNPKWYFYGWLFCAAMAIGHVSFFQNLFAGFTDESGRGYLQPDGGEGSYLTGFRPDFMLYSAFPIFIGYKLVLKEKYELSRIYLTLLNIYLCTNGIWMLCMYASYSNRIAYLSWFMYPIVLIYPFLKENLHSEQYKTFAKIMLYHLFFTLFMDLVYYKFIHA